MPPSKKAAHELGLPDHTEVVRLLEVLADELSYIEALRDDLLKGVHGLAGRVERICRSGRVDQKRAEMMTQVRRLSTTALRRIAGQFFELDTWNQEVVSALRNLDSHCSLIRSSRDGLYRQSRAWQPILREWEASRDLLEAALWQLTERTYHFLAPRFMPMQEWQAFVAGQRPDRPKPIAGAMKW